jgi:hypothetical protein
MLSVRGRDGMDQAKQNWSVQGPAPVLLFVCWLAPYDRSRKLLFIADYFLEGLLTLGPLKRRARLSESYKFCG